MKLPYSCRLVLLVLLWLALATPGQSQYTSVTIKQSEDGTNSYAAGQLIVRFDPAVVNANAVDDKDLQDGSLATFVSGEAMEQVMEALGPEAAYFPTHKIFAHMTTADTLSIDRLGDTIRIDKVWSAFVVELPPGLDEREAGSKFISLHPTVWYAHLNYVLEADIDPFTLATRPNDARYLPEQASLHPTDQYPDGHINAPLAWWYEKGNSTGRVKVGVVDSGIDFGHEEFNNGSTTGPKVVGGWDYLNNRSHLLSTDAMGHGTSVAGIIGARRRNSIGIAGLAGGNNSSASDVGVQLFDLSILGGNSLTSLVSRACAAIVEGSTRTPGGGFGFGLQILSNSYGVYHQSDDEGVSTQTISLLKDAVRTAYRNKTLVVASRGNHGVNWARYPSCFPDDWVINVGASGTNGRYKDLSNGDSYTSNYGRGVDLIAPGTSQLVTTTQSRMGVPGATQLYTTFNGTSAAVPHVSGTAALLLSYIDYQVLAPEDVEYLLQKQAKDQTAAPSAAGYDDYAGWGLLDAGATLDAVRKGPYQLIHSRVRGAGFALEAQNTSVVLSANYQGLAAGAYRADKYRVYSVQNNALIVPSGFQVLDVWKRNSSASTWSGANPIVPENDQIITLWNQNTVQVSGYTYFFRRDAAGRTINRWAPFDPTVQANRQFGVTLYVYNPELDMPTGFRSATSEAAEPTTAELYPNPATTEAVLRYPAPAHTCAEIRLLAPSGYVVRRWQKGPEAGNQHVQHVPLTDLAPGVYIYQVVTATQTYTGKLIKH